MPLIEGIPSLAKSLNLALDFLHHWVTIGEESVSMTTMTMEHVSDRSSMREKEQNRQVTF